VEVEPLCVLDFYVHEAYQRQGVGKALFEVRPAQHRDTAAVVSACPEHSKPCLRTSQVQQDPEL
jgi:GNAT superfamily N-acetyltransferase